MTYEDVLEWAGSQVNIARACRVEAPAVAAWKRKGIPFPRQCQLYWLSNHQLKPIEEDR